MQKTIYPLLLFLFFCHLQTRAQSGVLPLGVGIVSVSHLDKLPVMRFYTDTNAATPVKIISVVKDREEELIIKNAGQNKWFEPEFLKLDYYILVVRCIEHAGKWNKVLVNESTAYWVKQNKDIIYFSWPVFLKTQTTGISKIKNVALEIKLSPSDSATRLKMMEMEDCFVVMEVKGDWMKIKTSTELECSTSKRPVKLGWIKWRRNGKLLIEYGLTC
jgi:hypothetical protein